MALLTGTRVADIFAYPPDAIMVDPDFNPRDMTAPDTLAWIDEIAFSIKERGFDPDRPLLGRKAGASFIVTDGHCRLAAIRKLLDAGEPILGVPCRSEPQGTSREDRQLLSLRAPGKALTPLESAVAIKRLISWGWATDKIAAHLGKSTSWVTGCLDLAGAPKPLRDAVRNGEIAATEATRITRNDPDPVGTLERAKDHARAAGRERIKPRDVEAVTKPRTEAVSLCTLALAAVRAWREGDDALDFQMAMEALEKHFGPLMERAA